MFSISWSLETIWKCLKDKKINISTTLSSITYVAVGELGLTFIFNSFVLFIKDGELNFSVSVKTIFKSSNGKTVIWVIESFVKSKNLRIVSSKLRIDSGYHNTREQIFQRGIVIHSVTVDIGDLYRMTFWLNLYAF